MTEAVIIYFHEALRLTFYGWCIMLAYLVMRRTADWIRWRDKVGQYIPVRALDMPWILAFAAIFLVVQFVLFTRAVMVSFGAEPVALTPDLLLLPLALRMTMAVILISLFCYERRFKIKWLAAWALFSHATIAVTRIQW